MEPDRIRHLAICARDPRAVADFYQRTFHLRFVAESANGRAVYLSDGHINFAIIQADDTRPEGIYHFGFQVADIEASAAAAVALGASGPHEQRLNDRNVEAYVRDPAGTRVDLSAHGWSLAPSD